MPKSFKQFFEGCGYYSDEETYTPEQLDELEKELQDREWWHDLDAGLEGSHSDSWKEDPQWVSATHNDNRIEEIIAILKQAGRIKSAPVKLPGSNT